MPSLSQEGAAYLLDLGSDENRLTPTWVATVNRHLDAIVGSAEPAVLVTYGTGRFYSNGFDVAWLAENGDRIAECTFGVQSLLARVLTLPVPTIAAINGHAFGAGAMLALAHDFRVMRGDRGFFCLPEVDLEIPFNDGMVALIQAKLDPSSALLSMTTAKRFGGREAEKAGIVDAAVTDANLLADAKRHILPFAGKNQAVLGSIKAAMFRDVVQRLQHSDFTAETFTS
jgi:enoyl-CoA hydratase/carnithine racemase